MLDLPSPEGIEEFISRCLIVAGRHRREEMLKFQEAWEPEIEAEIDHRVLPRFAQIGKPRKRMKALGDRRLEVLTENLLNDGLTQGSLHIDRKSTRLNSSHIQKSRMPSSA